MADEVSRLIGKLGSGDYQEREAACVRLGELGGRRAVEALRAALDDNHESVGRAAARAFASAVGPGALGELAALVEVGPCRARRRAGLALGCVGTAEAHALLLRLLDHEIPCVREGAVLGLGEIRRADDVPALAARLQDESRFVRQAAAEALGGIGDPRALEPLIGALEDPEADVRKAAIAALDVLGDQRAAEALGRRLFDNYWEVETAALAALCKIGGPAALEAIVARLAKAGAHLRRQIAAVEDFYGTHSRFASEAFMGCLGNHWDMIGRLHSALNAFPPGDVEAAIVRFLPLSDNIGGKELALAAVRSGSAAAVDRVASLLHDHDQDYRYRAVWRLGQVGGPKAVALLREALVDEYWKVRAAAADALGRLGDAEALPRLISCLEDRNESVREAAKEALVKIGDPRAAPAVLRKGYTSVVAAMGARATAPLAAALGDFLSDPEECRWCQWYGKALIEALHTAVGCVPSLLPLDRDEAAAALRRVVPIWQHACRPFSGVPRDIKRPLRRLLRVTQAMLRDVEPPRAAAD